MLKGPLAIRHCQGGAGNIHGCAPVLPPAIHWQGFQSLAGRCVSLGSTADREEEEAKIVQLAGKADPGG